MFKRYEKLWNVWLWKYCPWVVIKGKRCGKGVLFEGKRFVRAAVIWVFKRGFQFVGTSFKWCCQPKKKKHTQRKRCELCFIQGLTKDCNSGDSLSVGLRNCSKDTGEEPVYVWVIVVKKSIWSNVHLDKRWPLITKNIYLKLMTLVLFEYVVLHHLLEFAQTHVHWVGDTIQPSYPLSPPSPSALNLSQHQGLFHWVSSSHQVAKVLELQHQSFQWIFRKMQESRVIEILSEIYIKLGMGPFPNG